MEINWIEFGCLWKRGKNTEVFITVNTPFTLGTFKGLQVMQTLSSFNRKRGMHNMFFGKLSRSLCFIKKQHAIWEINDHTLLRNPDFISKNVPLYRTAQSKSFTNIWKCKCYISIHKSMKYWKRKAAHERIQWMEIDPYFHL